MWWCQQLRKLTKIFLVEQRLVEAKELERSRLLNERDSAEAERQQQKGRAKLRREQAAQKRQEKHDREYEEDRRHAIFGGRPPLNPPPSSVSGLVTISRSSGP